jgi:hypothetical protein
MKIKNTKQAADTWAGQQIQPNTYYTIESSELFRWQTDSKVLTDLGSGDLVINNETQDITVVAEAIAYLLGTGAKDVKIAYEPPFAAKTVGTLKLYTRTHGQTFSLAQGSNNCDFTIPYNQSKFNGVEIIGGEVGDKVTLQVLDTATGTISTVPNYLLNTFGTTVNVPAGFYSRESKYDADMILGLQIRLVYNSISAKTIGVNYMIHELKP